jgi:hypothetical protein
VETVTTSDMRRVPGCGAVAFVVVYRATVTSTSGAVTRASGTEMRVIV